MYPNWSGQPNLILMFHFHLYNWSGQKLQAASLCVLPPKRRGNSHSAPAGRLKFIIFMALDGGGGVVV
jgi:hypothetical protein